MSFSENNQRVTNPSGPLELLEIANPSFTDPLRIANNSVDVISQGITYTGLNFGFKLPDDVSGSAPGMQLSISNVGTGATDELERITPGSVTIAKLIIIDRGTPDVHEHVYRLPIVSISATPSEITATAGVDAVMRQMACKQVANPHTLPGIF